MALKILFSVWLLNPIWHPFHVSVVDVQHDAEQQVLQMSQRIFLDDLEEALEGFHDLDYVDTASPDDPARLDSLIATYLKAKIFLRVNGESRDFTYVGSEKEGDARWCYFMVEAVPSVSTLEVTNVALMDVFDDQENIIHCVVGNQKLSYKLDKQTKYFTFEFDKE